MNIFDPHTHAMLEALLANEVRFIVVGGYAVNYHGFNRATGDIDLWIPPDNGPNKMKLFLALRALGISESSIAQLELLDFEHPTVFRDGAKPIMIDFMTSVSGIGFEQAWEKKVITELDGLKIPFLYFDHLILTKITTERTKDKLDVEELQKIARLKNRE
jgi:hypothetical protein